ncbi:MAG: transketolase C-terminal domain-containing protein, partial [Bacillota bacterium]|nr:transketolase C-terminal domain-containing protein [Bacillota bacterium]
AAMALAGLRPYAAIYSTFLQRAFDQIVHDVCIQKAEVVFCIDRAGLVGNDGETHHGYFDIGYLSILPNMTVLTAATREDLEEMLEYSIEHRGGPLAIRYPRGNAVTDAESGLTNKANRFEPYLAVGELGFCVGRNRVAIVTSGKMAPIVKRMSEASFAGHLPVIVLRKLCPLDAPELTALVSDVDLLITVDDHMEHGGIADIVRRGLPSKRVRSIGYSDFVTHGDTEDLLRALRMDATGLAQRVREICEHDDKTDAHSIVGAGVTA